MAAPDIRWTQRFSNYQRALSQLTKFIEKGELNELEQTGLIKAFEFTHEPTQPVGNKDRRLQNRLNGPYFTRFLVNISILTLQIPQNLSSLSRFFATTPCLR